MQNHTSTFSGTGGVLGPTTPTGGLSIGNTGGMTLTSRQTGSGAHIGGGAPISGLTLCLGILGTGGGGLGTIGAAGTGGQLIGHTSVASPFPQIGEKAL